MFEESSTLHRYILTLKKMFSFQSSFSLFYSDHQFFYFIWTTKKWNHHIIFIEVYLIYNVSGVQEKWFIYIKIYLLFHILFHYKSLINLVQIHRSCPANDLIVYFSDFSNKHPWKLFRHSSDMSMWLVTCSSCVIIKILLQFPVLYSKS